MTSVHLAPTSTNYKASCSQWWHKTPFTIRHNKDGGQARWENAAKDISRSLQVKQLPHNGGTAHSRLLLRPAVLLVGTCWSGKRTVIFERPTIDGEDMQYPRQLSQGTLGFENTKTIHDDGHGSILSTIRQNLQ